MFNINKEEINNYELFYNNLIKEKKNGIIEIQIINLTNKINLLQKHFLIHKKDFHSKRGLIKLVSNRKKLLKYLKNKFVNRYNNITYFLKLRKI